MIVKLIGSKEITMSPKENATVLDVLKDFEKAVNVKILEENEPKYYIVLVDDVELSIYGLNSPVNNVKKIVIIPLIHGG